MTPDEAKIILTQGSGYESITGTKTDDCCIDGWYSIEQLEAILILAKARPDKTMTTKEIAHEATTLYGGNGLTTQQAKDALKRFLYEHVKPEFVTDLAPVCEATAAFAVAKIYTQNLETLDGKQRDYGDANLTKYGEMGVEVRMSDKWSRLTNLLKHEGANDAGPHVRESIEDTLLDLSNYALILYVMRKRLWPKP